MPQLSQQDLTRIYLDTNGNKSLFDNEVNSKSQNYYTQTQIDDFYNGIRDFQNSNNRSTSIGETVVKGFVRSVKAGGLDTYGGYEHERVSLGNMAEDSIKFIQENNLKSADTYKKILTNIFDEIALGNATYVAQQKDLLHEINNELGFTGKLSNDFRDQITESVPYALKLNIGFSELSESVSKMVKESGKLKPFSTETINEMLKVSRLAFNSAAEAAAAIEPFNEVSIGAKKAIISIEESARKSLELGLNSKETTKLLVENIGKLNQFGFKNGVKGLNEMVIKAKELKLDLNSVFSLAEKVMDPSNAISLVSELQVLGGAIGDLNDPFRLMYMSTNNVEGFTDAIRESAETLAQFNPETKRFEVVGADLRRAREMANAFGMSLKEVTDLSIQASQRTQASIDLSSRGFLIDDEDKEFITNLAQMNEEGRMVVEISDKEMREKFGRSEIILDEMSEDQKNMLLAYREQFKKTTTDDIIADQFTLVENIERYLSYLAAVARNFVGDNVIPRINTPEELYGVYESAEKAAKNLIQGKLFGGDNNTTTSTTTQQTETNIKNQYVPVSLYEKKIQENNFLAPLNPNSEEPKIDFNKVTEKVFKIDQKITSDILNIENIEEETLRKIQLEEKKSNINNENLLGYNVVTPSPVNIQNRNINTENQTINETSDKRSLIKDNKEIKVSHVYTFNVDGKVDEFARMLYRNPQRFLKEKEIGESFLENNYIEV